MKSLMLFWLLVFSAICSLHAAKAPASATKTPASSASTSKADLTALRLSTYNPTNTRDPFLRVGQEMPRPVKLTVTSPQSTEKVTASAFRLDALLHAPKSATAIINGQEVVLNKETRIETPLGTFRVKMLHTWPDRLLLEVEGHQIELKLEESDTGILPKAKAKEASAGGSIPAKPSTQK